MRGAVAVGPVGVAAYGPYVGRWNSSEWGPHQGVVVTRAVTWLTCVRAHQTRSRVFYYWGLGIVID